MASDGNYPLLVFVWNRFETDGINLKVQFNHWPNAENPDPDDPTKSPTNDNIYEIMPGDCLGFPLYWVNESLTIQFQIPTDVAVPIPYYILLEPKVKCTSEQLVVSGNGTISLIPSGSAKYIDETSKNGVWEINNATLTWEITLVKWLFDPETTNVSIGPDLP